MRYVADLHIHSKYSRATSRDCDLENLATWGCLKGISVIGTGDFTHPAWREEIRTKLVPAEAGLFRLRSDIEHAVHERLPPGCQQSVRFLLSVEISNIYKRDEGTRKVHNLVFAPDLQVADAIVAQLDRIGNLHADGRPILGLDSRDLLEIVLTASEDAFLVPAHIWTPWFSALGARSGFDSIDACFADLAGHIFAVETGLSSDPSMNWRLSSLDRFRLISNSDAHSPPKLGREATLFDTELSYHGILRALRTGEGFGGSVEFFPEEGKYHLDGHRKCNTRQSPEQTRARDGMCAVCGKPVTMGVLHRVEALADRPSGAGPERTAPFYSFVPLPEIIGELLGVGTASKKVARTYQQVLARLGPELDVLANTAPEDIDRVGPPLLGEAIRRMRRGDVRTTPGYDGEYGVVRLFDAAELHNRSVVVPLFAPATATELPCADVPPSPPIPDGPTPSPTAVPGHVSLPVQDPEQFEAIHHGAGHLLIVAGPGTGKTHTLTQRIAHLVTTGRAAAESILAITFTRKAASEMGQRLSACIGASAQQVAVHTFHAFGLELLQQFGDVLGYGNPLQVHDENACSGILQNHLRIGQRQAHKLLRQIAHHLHTCTPIPEGSDLQQAQQTLRRHLRAQGAIDYDDLIHQATWLIAHDDRTRGAVDKRCRWLFVDEYQDLDHAQYRLLRALSAQGASVCAIGDPDQAIYGFRGGSSAFFAQFCADFPGASQIRLRHNHRSTRPIVDAAVSLLCAADGNAERALEACRGDGPPVVVHSCATAAAEAETIAHAIEKLVGGYSFFSVDSGRVDNAGARHPFSDIAVLCRTAAQGDAIVRAMQRAGIPVQRRGDGPLEQQPTMLALLTHLDQTQDPLRALDALPNDLVVGVAAEDLGQHVSVLRPVLLACGGDLAAAKAQLATMTEMDTWDPRAERISLLTMHAAKGLEFPVVFIAGCEDGLLPLRFARAQDVDVAEERRVFFVGMTRAKDQLVLTWARHRGSARSAAARTVSPFVSDLPGAYVSHVGAAKQERKRQQMRLFAPGRAAKPAV